jgi:hypothetical protein
MSARLAIIRINVVNLILKAIPTITHATPINQ